MQKVLDLLERYVEWVALAIGGLFLLLMVFFYILGTPVSTKVGDREVTPANVEAYTYQNAGQRLEQAMNHSQVPSATIESYAAEFSEHMSKLGTQTPQSMPAVWVASIGAPASLLTAEHHTESSTPQAVGGVPENLPAPRYYGFSSGKSTVETDPAKGSSVPVSAPPAVGMPGMPPYGPGSDYYGGPPPAYQPTTPQPAAGGAAAKPAGTDKVWVTVAFTIDSDEIAAAFEAAKVPANLATVFLRLDPVRQELLADGSWGNDTRIEPLAYHQVPAFPASGSPVDQRMYADWATRNAATLLSPSFYPKLAGDTWYAPGQDNPNKIQETRPTPVIQPGGPGMPGQTPRMRGRGGQGMPTDMGGMPTQRRGRQRYAPQDEQRPALPYMQVMPPEVLEQLRQEEAARAAAGYGPYGPSGFATARPAVPEGYRVPAGSFVPKELDSDIFVWFHDDTVQPGKTYRYKMSYRLRNPLFGTGTVNQGEATRVFAISSAESDWSEPISVDPITRFFVATGVSTSSASVRFEVFHWQGGKWHQKQFTVSPGDMIGRVEDSIDFQTGWTLVDLDVSPYMSDGPVLVADRNGNLERKRYDAGEANRFKREIGWVDPNAQPRQQPGMMGPDGMPYGPPPDYMMGPGY